MLYIGVGILRILSSEALHETKDWVFNTNVTSRQYFSHTVAKLIPLNPVVTRKHEHATQTNQLKNNILPGRFQFRLLILHVDFKVNLTFICRE